MLFPKFILYVLPTIKANPQTNAMVQVYIHMKPSISALKFGYCFFFLQDTDYDKDFKGEH